jgi:hypothetical protein
MARKIGLLLSLLIVCTILVLTGIFSGCSQNPAGPVDNSQFDPATVETFLNELASYGVIPETGFQTDSTDQPARTPQVECSYFEDSSRISHKNGGVVVLSDELPGSNYFTVPQNAVPKDTTILIQTWRIESGDLMLHEFRFTPEGLAFHPNATFVLDAELFANANGDVPTAIAWVYYDKAAKEWNLESVITVADDGRFYVPVYHFSIYAAGALEFGLSPGGE